MDVNWSGFDNGGFDVAKFNEIDGPIGYPRRAIGVEIDQEFTPRRASQVDLDAEFVARRSMTDIIAEFVTRRRAIIEIDQEFSARRRASLAQVVLTEPAGPYSTGTSVEPDVVAYQQGIMVLPDGTINEGEDENEPTLNVSLTVTGAPEPLKRANPATFTLRASGPTEFNISVPGGRSMHPESAGGWNGILDTSNAKTKRLRFSAAWGEGSKFRYTGVILASEDAKAMDSWYNLSVSGTDSVHYKLSVEDQNYPSQVSTRTNSISMHGLVTAICSTYEVPCTFLGVPNYTVGVFHPQQGRPIDWIADLIEPVLAEYRVVDERIEFYPIGGVSGARWHYTTEMIIPSRTSQTSLGKIVNSVKIVRTAQVGGSAKKRADDDAGSGAGLQEVLEVTDFNDDVDFAFSEPLYSVTHQVITQDGGVFDDIRLRDQGGNIVSVRANAIDKNYPTAIAAAGHPGVPIASVTVRWRSNVDPRTRIDSNLNVATAPLSGYGKLIFRGGKLSSPRVLERTNSEVPSFDPGYTVTATRAASVTEHGTRFAELQANPLISSQAVAQRYADLFVEYVGRQKRNYTFTAPFNPLMRPGDKVRWDDLDLNTSKILTVEQVQHALADGTRYITRFDAYELL